MKVLLVNPNLMKPPVSPVGLDLLADSLEAGGFQPVLLDLAWSTDPAGDVASVDPGDFLFAALSVRNIDDSFFPGSDECLFSHREITRTLRNRGLKVAAGGIGLSIFPEQVRDFIEAGYAVAGDGEEAVVCLARALSGRGKIQDVPGLAGVNPPARVDLSGAAAPKRTFIDNLRYFKEGGQVGFETKRGCPMQCIACPEPRVKGASVRMRQPETVAQELRSLLSRGIDVFHTCDSEFNVPKEHALAVCEALSTASIGRTARWYAYCSPASFDLELARAMRKAGCEGVDFSADHGDDRMLQILKCPHTTEDLERTAEACRSAGLRFMFDLLLGAPGESRPSITRTIDLMRRLNPTRVGVSLGIRLYPGCAVLEKVDLSAGNPSLHFNRFDDSLLHPLYFREKALGDGVETWLEEYIGGDRRFFYSASSHNYDGNSLLEELVSKGCRGAFWDILARHAGD